MILLYKIDAVHSIAKRVIKSSLSNFGIVTLLDQLYKAGYEKENIQVTLTDTIYEEGDVIEISKELYDSLPDDLLDGFVDNIRNKYDAKYTINWLYNDKPKFPIKCKLSSRRINNEMGCMEVEWYGSNTALQKTNFYILKYLGFKIKEKEFSFIPIAEADDNLLDERDLVRKYIMKQNNCDEAEACRHMKIVSDAMNECGVVFYMP